MPIVDIAVAVRSFADINEKQAELEAQGFYRRSWNDEGQELFACGSHYDGTGDRQTHFIHVVLADSAEWRNYLNFRDYLNTFPEAAKAYEVLKLSLAAANPEDTGREKYTSGKHDFIRQTLRKALVWSLLGKTMHVIVDRPVGYRYQSCKSLSPQKSVIYVRRVSLPFFCILNRSKNAAPVALKTATGKNHRDSGGSLENVCCHWRINTGMFGENVVWLRHYPKLKTL